MQGINASMHGRTFLKGDLTPTVKAPVPVRLSVNVPDPEIQLPNGGRSQLSEMPTEVYQSTEVQNNLSLVRVNTGGENYSYINPAAKAGGRLGNTSTRTQIGEIATELESRGYTISRGGERFPEEYLKLLGGGRKGGSYLDLTAIHPEYGTLRINTVDIYKNSLPTLRELNNAARIGTQIAPGEHLLLIPKR